MGICDLTSGITAAYDLEHPDDRILCKYEYEVHYDRADDIEVKMDKSCSLGVLLTL